MQSLHMYAIITLCKKSVKRCSSSTPVLEGMKDGKFYFLTLGPAGWRLELDTTSPQVKVWSV